MRGLWDKTIRRGYRLAYLGLRAWWFVRRPATHGTCVALWHDGKVLLIHTSYRNCYSLPGGFVHRGEPSEQAARREVQEEVGIDLAGCKLRLAWSGTLLFESRPDTVDIWETVLEKAPAVRIASHELVWADWVYPADASGRRLLPHVAIYLAQKEKGENPRIE
ncbi:MAG: NUDIX hydrolase [Planctomycetes bacterium]|nr:NUDIX hydrolase [Planctomycetota bacterium]